MTEGLITLNIDEFYLNLKPLKNFSDFDKKEYYQELPNSWYIITCDIINNTRDESFDLSIATLCIVSVLNAAEIKNGIPFIVDGKNVVILVPPTIITNIRAVLYSTSLFVKDSFGIDINMNIILYSDLKKTNSKVEVVRHFVTDKYNQTFIFGGGIGKFRKLISADNSYKINSSFLKIEPNFSGFECRIENIKPRIPTVKLSIYLKGQDETGLLKSIFTKIQSNKVIEAVDFELSYGDKIYNELDIRNVKWFKKQTEFLKISATNLRIKNGLIKRGFSYNDYKAYVASSSITSWLCDGLSMYIHTDALEKNGLLNELKALYKENIISFEISPVQSMSVSAIVMEEDFIAYFINNIRSGV